MKLARIGITAPFMVMLTLTWFQRDAVEQDLHVLDAVDGHTRLADIADDTRMVAVIAPVRAKVEGHRNPPAGPAASARR